MSRIIAFLRENPIPLLAIIGLPPFGIFIAEFALFRAGFAAGRSWLMGAVLMLLAVAFVSLIRQG